MKDKHKNKKNYLWNLFGSQDDISKDILQHTTIGNSPFLAKTTIDVNVKKVLLKIGISSNNKGFFFILEAYNILNTRQIHFNMITLYEMIGNKFGENRSVVERLMRYVINKAYKKSEILKKIYEKKPNNSQFLYDLVFNFEIFEEMALNGGK